MAEVVVIHKLTIPKNCSECGYCDHDYGAHGGRRPSCRLAALFYAKERAEALAHNDFDKADSFIDVRDDCDDERPKHCPLMTDIIVPVQSNGRW